MRRGLVVAVAVVSLAGCSGRGDGDKQAGPPERAPAWEVSVSGTGPLRYAGVTGDTVVVRGDQLVVGLSRADGSQRWKVPIEPDTEVRVTPKSVVVYDDEKISAYDVGTGRQGFSHKNPQPGRAAVSSTAVFVHSCAVLKTDCSVIAYGLPDGAVLWRYPYTRDSANNPLVQTPGDDSIRLIEPGRYRQPLIARPADVVLISREGPSASTPLSVLDAATGKVIGSRRVPTFWTRVVDGSTVISWNDAKNCDVRLTGYSVRTGEQLWTHPAGRWGEPAVGQPDCDNITWTPAVDGTTAAVTTPDRRPSLIKLDTGEVRWTGDPGTHVMDLSAKIVLARAGDGDGPLVGLDPADGHPRWRIELPVQHGVEQIHRSAVVGDRLAFSFDDISAGEVLQVRDAGTGQLQWRAKGSNWLLGAGTDWLVTAADGDQDDSDPKTVRLYTD